jgi:hypothetical protein
VAAIVIDRVQTMQLGEARAAELKVTFGERCPAVRSGWSSPRI